jgi:hypothetical protein
MPKHSLQPHHNTGLYYLPIQVHHYDENANAYEQEKTPIAIRMTSAHKRLGDSFDRLK